MSTFVPTAPRAFVSVGRHAAFLKHFDRLETELAAQKKDRDDAFAASRSVQNAATLSVQHLLNMVGQQPRPGMPLAGLDVQ